jgi:hypothetical protein
MAKAKMDATDASRNAKDPQKIMFLTPGHHSSIIQWRKRRIGLVFS